MKKELLLLKIAIVILLLGFILCCHVAWDIYSFGKQNEVTKADNGLVAFSSPTPTSRYKSWSKKLLFYKVILQNLSYHIDRPPKI